MSQVVVGEAGFRSGVGRSPLGHMNGTLHTYAGPTPTRDRHPAAVGADARPNVAGGSQECYWRCVPWGGTRHGCVGLGSRHEKLLDQPQLRSDQRPAAHPRSHGVDHANVRSVLDVYGKAKATWQEARIELPRFERQLRGWLFEPLNPNDRHRALLGEASDDRASVSTRALGRGALLAAVAQGELGRNAVPLFQRR